MTANAVDEKDSGLPSTSTTAGDNNDEVSLLWQACATGNETHALQLIRAGAEVNSRRTLDSVSCLYIAAQNGFWDICRHLIEAGAEVNTRRNTNATPLFIATQRNHTRVVDLLLEAGADTELENDQHCTPFVLACNLGHTECARMLLDSGCNRRHRATGLTPMSWCRAEKRHETLEVVRSWIFATILQPVMERHLLSRYFRCWVAYAQVLLEANRVAHEQEQEQIHRKERRWQAMLDGAPIPSKDELQFCSFQTHLALPDSWVDVTLAIGSPAPTLRRAKQQGATNDQASVHCSAMFTTEPPQRLQDEHIQYQVAVGVEAKARQTLASLTEPLAHPAVDTITNAGYGLRTLAKQLTSQSAAYRRQEKSREVLVAGTASELLQLHEALMSQHFDWNEK